MVYRVVNEVDAGSERASDRAIQGKSDSGKKVEINGESRSGSGGEERKMEEEEERDAVFFRLEMLGYRVGQGLVERYVKFYSGRRMNYIKN